MAGEQPLTTKQEQRHLAAAAKKAANKAKKQAPKKPKDGEDDLNARRRLSADEIMASHDWIILGAVMPPDKSRLVTVKARTNYADVLAMLNPDEHKDPMPEMLVKICYFKKQMEDGRVFTKAYFCYPRGMGIPYRITRVDGVLHMINKLKVEDCQVLDFGSFPLRLFEPYILKYMERKGL